jgi:arylsulfatase A-like enzyme
VNGFPLKVGEMTLGDHLRPLGMSVNLVGKTHMRTDVEGMERIGLAPETMIGARVKECGFDAYERDDGLYPEGHEAKFPGIGQTMYDHYLRRHGYESANPWHDFANSGRTEDDDLASGWFLKHCAEPAAIAEEHSETPYMTMRGMEFIEQAGDEPWLLHLSYIKPHWPYIVPAPYHNMYGPEHVIPVKRSAEELQNPHPVYDAFVKDRIGKAFSRDDVRETVIPAYMGLIKQCDDQMGRLFKWLEDTGRMDDTMIVLTSDHGDYLGDHWLGEKELFHDASVKAPLIIYDPSPEADATRGTVCDELTESIDLAPTFVEIAGGVPRSNILEGRSLMPFIRGENPKEWREYAISEYDYSPLSYGEKLEVEPKDARLFMVVDKKWKFIHAIGFRPQLFDLENDPDEFKDVGGDPACSEIIKTMYDRLFEWATRNHARTTVSDDDITANRNNTEARGVLIGVYDEHDLPPEFSKYYTGKPRPA